jgi:hypothetical protein
MQMGRDGHQAAMVRVDRLCQAIMRHTRGKVEITLMSDHGHSLAPCHRMRLKDLLSSMGYRVGSELRGPDDVVVPSLGLVTYAALHTRSPAAVAADVVGADKIDLAAYRDGDDVVVLSAGGRARVSKNDTGFRYQCEFGDPLQLKAVIAELAERGLVDENGYADDHALLDATVRHIYPDPLARLHRAFHGLVRYTPDVLLSLSDGWCWGSSIAAEFIDVKSAHGGLDLRSSTGFIMTTAGSLPDAMRMEDVAEKLRDVGAWPHAAARIINGAPDTGAP